MTPWVAADLLDNIALPRHSPSFAPLVPAVFRLAAAVAATGQTILGPPLAADQMIPVAYLSGQAG
jgi:hypothetical protein